MSLFRNETLSAKDVAYNLKRPCNDCPFRRDAPDHEGVAGSVVEYLDNIEAGRFAHTCHKTDNRTVCDGPRNFKGDKTEHCAGALHFLIRAKKSLQLPLLEAMVDGRLDYDAAKKHARRSSMVFASVAEFVSYYVRMIERIIEQKKADPKVCCVFPENAGDPPEMIRLSVARAQGLSIVECCKCGQPASHYDPKWPIFQEMNFCHDHIDDGLAEVQREAARHLQESM